MDQTPSDNRASEARRTLDLLSIPKPDGVSYGSYLKVR